MPRIEITTMSRNPQAPQAHPALVLAVISLSLALAAISAAFAGV